MPNSYVCCSHVVSGGVWVFTQVHSHVICIPWFITEFVNFDAETFSFLWNVLPEDNPALEFYHHLVHCQMLWGVTEFSVGLIQLVKDSLVSIVGHILRLRQVSVNYLQNAENAVCVKICLVSWSRRRTDCVAVWVSTSSHVVCLSIRVPSAELMANLHFTLWMCIADDSSKVKGLKAVFFRISSTVNIQSDEWTK